MIVGVLAGEIGAVAAHDLGADHPEVESHGIAEHVDERHIGESIGEIDGIAARAGNGWPARLPCQYA